MKQGLKIFYDEEEDILYMAKEGQEEEFIELQPGINVELDKDRQVIGIEILHASKVLKEVIEPVRQKIKV
jgi:uncharacterized protein YuzE